MWPALVLSSSATGLALGLGRLKVLALIPATIVLSLTVATGGVMFGVRWGTIALAVIATVKISQSCYLIGGLLSEAPIPRAAPRASLRLDLIRAAQFAASRLVRNYEPNFRRRAICRLNFGSEWSNWQSDTDDSSQGGGEPKSIGRRLIQTSRGRHGNLAGLGNACLRFRLHVAPILERREETGQMNWVLSVRTECPLSGVKRT